MSGVLFGIVICYGFCFHYSRYFCC